MSLLLMTMLGSGIEHRTVNFKRLQLNDWKQFHTVCIDFHPNLTVLTGANGSGKTTILNILARHFGWSFSELATPFIDERGFFRYHSRFFKFEILNPSNTIGEIEYSNNAKCTLKFPTHNQAQYHIELHNQQTIRGLNIPSHRPVFYYQAVQSISTQRRTKQQAFDITRSSIYNKLFATGGNTPPANYYIKETLLNWAIGGAGNEFIQEDLELKQYFLGFQEILRKILPNTLGFQEIKIRNYEIVLITETGDFMIDAVSGGVSAIIDLGWQIFTYSQQNSEPITVLIDEVENHLHATMQRTILPSLIEAFPNVQFIVSTHSPLIVGSVRDSNVYAFRYNEENKVYIEKLDLINKAKNASEILNEVLGVHFTMPIWVEDELRTVIEKYSNSELNSDSFNEMRNELKSIGLEELMPLAIEKTIENKDDQVK